MKFFSFVQKHCALFFYLCWIYIAACILLAERFHFPGWLEACMALPLNLISWPVAVAIWKNQYATMMIRRVSVAMVVISTGLPIFTLMGM